MQPTHRAAAAPLTWVIAIALVLAIGVTVTCTRVLWGKTNLWVRQGGLERVYIWQTYEVAQKIYYPRRPAPIRVAMLGNSRLWIPGRDAYVERELARLAPGTDVRVDNLAIWGAKIGDLEIITRHLERLDPTLVVLTLGSGDLVATEWSKLVNPTGALLDIGWADGPLPAASWAERVDRWVRTVWPLYRFRRFAKEMVKDRLFPVSTDTQFPHHFASVREYFGFINGPRQAAKVDAAYADWRQKRTLSSFVAYLEAGGTAFAFKETLPDPATLTADSPGARLLDAVVARLARWPGSFILLTPENPLLDQDTEGKYHRPGFSEQSAALINEIASRYGVRVVDGRRWMPADAFADFLHVFPDFSGFQTPLAKEILYAIRTAGREPA